NLAGIQRHSSHQPSAPPPLNHHCRAWMAFPVSLSSRESRCWHCVYWLLSSRNGPEANIGPAMKRYSTRPTPTQALPSHRSSFVDGPNVVSATSLPVPGEVFGTVGDEG